MRLLCGQILPPYFLSFLLEIVCRGHKNRATPILALLLYGKSIRIKVACTRNIAVDDPSEKALIVSVEIFGEAEVQTENTAQYTIIHSNFCMSAMFVNYSAAKVHRENQFQPLSLQVTHLITPGRNVKGRSLTWIS